MTDENRRYNVKLQLERSGELLKAAQVLHDNGFAADAVSRCYYAMLHAALALLLTEGVEPKTHSGVASQLNLLFVRNGRFPPSFTRRLAHLEDDRASADYDVTAVYGEEDSLEALDEAKTFCSQCLDYLGQWL